MTLYRSAEDIPVGSVDMGATAFTTTLVHGASASLMVAERPAGYHSRPHTHECEQLNLVQSGALHVYCDECAYRLGPGDVLRIPAGAVHWSWNRSAEPCVLIEVHAPGMQADPQIAPIAVGLFGEGEDANGPGPVNEDVDLPAEVIRRIEAADPVATA